MKVFVLFIICFSVVSAKLDSQWWKHASVYQIIVPTFKDSNGDGIGDIKGITSKLDHLTDLGVNVIYLSSILDNSAELIKNSEIRNYRNIDPRLGTIEDFEELLKQLKIKGIKLLIDIEINHTGKEHEWFLKSEKNIQPYTDYYIWDNPSYYDNETGKFNPPNDWTSHWKYSKIRKQFYYYSFRANKPDLNLRNEKVIDELQDIMAFWLDKGVAGFHLDQPHYYIKNLHLDSYDGAKYQKESLKIVNKIRIYLDKYNEKHGIFDRILLTKKDSYYRYRGVRHFSCFGTKNFPLYHFIYSSLTTYSRYDFDAAGFNGFIQFLQQSIPKGETAAWIWSEREIKSLCLKNSVFSDILIIIMSLLPGVIFYTYGQEIALPMGQIRETVVLNDEKFITKSYILNPSMQWDDSLNAGFSKHMNPSFPTTEDYPTRNVKHQKFVENSHYNLFKNLMKLRKTETLKNGDFQSKVYSINVLVFWRSYLGHPSYIMCINLGDEKEEVDFTKLFKNLPENLYIEVASTNAGYHKGHTVGEGNFILTLQPFSGVVISSLNYLP